MIEEHSAQSMTKDSDTLLTLFFRHNRALSWKRSLPFPAMITLAESDRRFIQRPAIGIYVINRIVTPCHTLGDIKYGRKLHWCWLMCWLRCWEDWSNFRCWLVCWPGKYRKNRENATMLTRLGPEKFGQELIVWEAPTKSLRN